MPRKFVVRPEYIDLWGSECRLNTFIDEDEVIRFCEYWENDPAAIISEQLIDVTDYAWTIDLKGLDHFAVEDNHGHRVDFSVIYDAPHNGVYADSAAFDSARLCTSWDDVADYILEAFEYAYIPSGNIERFVDDMKRAGTDNFNALLA